MNSFQYEQMKQQLRPIFLTFLLGCFFTTSVFCEDDKTHKPVIKRASNPSLSFKSKEDFSAKLSLEEVYGISEKDYNDIIQLKEQRPEYYRKIIENEHYAWFEPFGMKGSTIYLQGKWIYPYLVEGLTEIELEDENIFYPPKLIDEKIIFVSYSEVKVRLLHHINRLYINKNYNEYFNRVNFFNTYSDTENEINDLVDHKNLKVIHQLKISLLNEYCLQNKKAIYCEINHINRN